MTAMTERNEAMKTISQVAKELNVKVWRIRHALDANYIDKPPMFGGRFVFADNDVASLKNYFSLRKERIMKKPPEET